MTAARLAVRVQQVDSTELGAQAMTTARNDVETHLPSHESDPSGVIGQVDDADHSSFATSLFRVVESLQVVVELIDKTAKVCIS